MGWTLSEAKKRLGDKAYKQLSKQVKENTSRSKLPKIKQRSPAEVALEVLLKTVFEPDYSVITEEMLVPGRNYKSDFVIHALRLSIEVDGWVYHGKYLKDFKRDREKDYFVFLEGYSTVRIPATEALKRKDVVLAKLRQIRSESERRLLLIHEKV